MKRKKLVPYAQPHARLFWFLGLGVGALALVYGVIALLTSEGSVAVGALIAGTFALAAALAAPYIEREYIASAVALVGRETMAAFALLATLTNEAARPPAARDQAVTEEGGCEK